MWLSDGQSALPHSSARTELTRACVVDRNWRGADDLRGPLHAVGRHDVF